MRYCLLNTNLHSKLVKALDRATVTHANTHIHRHFLWLSFLSKTDTISIKVSNSSFWTIKILHTYRRSSCNKNWFLEVLRYFPGKHVMKYWLIKFQKIVGCFWNMTFLTFLWKVPCNFEVKNIKKKRLATVWNTPKY